MFHIQRREWSEIKDQWWLEVWNFKKVSKWWHTWTQMWSKVMSNNGSLIHVLFLLLLLLLLNVTMWWHVPILTLWCILRRNIITLLFSDDERQVRWQHIDEHYVKWIVMRIKLQCGCIFVHLRCEHFKTSEFNRRVSCLCHKMTNPCSVMMLMTSWSTSFSVTWVKQEKLLSD